VHDATEHLRRVPLDLGPLLAPSYINTSTRAHTQSRQLHTINQDERSHTQGKDERAHVHIQAHTTHTRMHPHLIAVPLEAREHGRRQLQRGLQDFGHHGRGTRLLQVQSVVDIVRTHIGLRAQTQRWGRAKVRAGHRAPCLSVQGMGETLCAHAHTSAGGKWHVVVSLGLGWLVLRFRGGGVLTAAYHIMLATGKVNRSTRQAVCACPGGCYGT